MILKNQYFFVLFFFFNFLNLSAQTISSVEGKIYNAATMTSIAGANIMVVETNLGTSSNQNGFYFLDFTNLVKATISVSHIGFKTSIKKIDLKKGQKIVLNFYLKDSVITSEVVEIIAHQSLNSIDNLQRIHSLKSQEISILPVNSVNQLIDYTSGVISSNTTSFFSNRTIVSMRGMPANDQGRTLVIFDGMPLNKADGGSVNWNLLKKNIISEIKVIKGPSSAKYGSGAMGGVIEIFSKHPEKPFMGDVQIEYGTYNTTSANLFFSGIAKSRSKFAKFYWLVNSDLRKSNGYITIPEIFKGVGDTTIIPSNLQEYSTLVKLGYDFGNNNTIELSSNFFDDKRGNGVKVFENFGAYSKHTTLSNVATFKGMRNFIKWQINVFNNIENYFRVYEYLKEKEYKLYEADAIRQDFGIQSDFEIYKIKNNKITTGFHYKNGSVDGSDTYYTSTDIIHNKGKIDIMALYIQNEFKILSDKITSNFGLRYDMAKFYDALFSIDYPSYSIQFYEKFQTENISDKFWDALSPRFSINWQPNEKLRFLFSASRGFRAPILDDMCRTGMRKGTFAVANPDLKPEFNDAIDLGGDLLVYKNIYLSLSGFYSIGSDFMYYISTGDTVNMGYRFAPIIKKSNIGKVEIKGIETEVKFEINQNISLFGNYTYTLAKIFEHYQKSKVDSNLTGKYLTDIPNHKAVAGIRIFTKHINSSVIGKYYGTTWINEFNSIENEYFNSDKFNGYITIDLRIEWKIFKQFQIALQIENIFDKKFINSRQQQNPGRMFFIYCNVRF